MADWFLRTHGVPGAPLCYDLGGPFTPVSIRDQMLRAQELVRRLYREGVISAKRPLVIVGAGAAGATAALYADACGVPVTIIEKARQPFGRQHGCTSRWVDPTQYDWPMPHWDARMFPWQGTGGAPVTRVPLPWRASWASHLNIGWARQLMRATRVRRLHGRVVTTIASHGSGSATLLDVTIDAPSGGHLAMLSSQGALVSATGFGTERCVVGSFRGWAFWDNDPLHWPHRGLVPGARVEAVVSGAGDGALQDYIRIATGMPSAAHVWDRLQHIPMATPLVTELLAAEDHLKCAYACAGHDDDDHALLQEIQRRYEHVVDAWYAAERPAIDAVLGTLVDPLVDVRHVFACDHFTRVYSLNRFLVLLLHRYSRRAVPHRYVVGVSGVTHVCALDPWKCHGQLHDVDLGLHQRCTAPRGQFTGGLAANLVILRHGIAPPGPPIAGAPAGPYRHALAHYPLP